MLELTFRVKMITNLRSFDQYYKFDFFVFRFMPAEDQSEVLKCFYIKIQLDVSNSDIIPLQFIGTVLCI